MTTAKTKATKFKVNASASAVHIQRGAVIIATLDLPYEEAEKLAAFIVEACNEKLAQEVC